MTIAYLDPDDEITSAVARLRASDDVRVALVLPPGSRIATSRINFRLLAHEAREHQRRLAVVAGEAGVRAVAVSAGLPAYASVAEYEASLETAHAAAAAEAAAADAGVVGVVGAAASTVAAGEAPPARRKARRSLAAAVEALPPAAAVDEVAAGAAAGVPARRGGLRRGGPAPDLPVVTTRERSRGQGNRGLWIGISGVLLVALVVAAGWVAFNVLPTATITVTPATEAVGPVGLTVTADPAATAADPANAIVPAQTISLPVTATDTFNATGTKAVDTAATGTVTFFSHNTASRVNIPSGTQVATASGVTFVTTAGVIVPRAVFGGRAGTANTPITASASGPAGNVPAGAISQVSANIETQLVNFNDPVSNAAPTTGGTHTVVPIVKQADYAAAVSSLQAALRTQVDAASRDPSNVPAGVTLIPATAAVGPATANQPASAIVNKQEATFTLTLSGTGTIEGVDPTLVGQVASARLASSVPSGYQLFAGSVKPVVGPAVVSAGTITFSASATGQMSAKLDPAALVQQVRGKTVEQARVILAALGTVTIETWPFYVNSVPDDPGHVTLTVSTPEAPPGASPGVPVTPAPATTIVPGASATPGTTVMPTTGPTATVSAT